jgi:hypothetical protein
MSIALDYLITVLFSYMYMCEFTEFFTAQVEIDIKRIIRKESTVSVLTSNI